MDSEEVRPRRMSSTSRLLCHECQCDDNNCLGFHCPCYGQQHEMCLADSCCPTCVKMKNENMVAAQPPVVPCSQRGANNSSTMCSCDQMRQKSANRTSQVFNFQSSFKPSSISKDLKLKKPQKSKSAQAHASSKAAKVSCSCKKSHCLKKYCHCFALGQKCSDQCQCEDCQNNVQKNPTQRRPDQDLADFADIDEQSQESESIMDIDQYLEDKDYEHVMMPVSMEFQLPDLRNAYHF